MYSFFYTEGHCKAYFLLASLFFTTGANVMSHQTIEMGTMNPHIENNNTREMAVDKVGTPLLESVITRFGIKALEDEWFQKSLYKGNVIMYGFLRTEDRNFYIPYDVLNMLEEYLDSKNMDIKLEIVIDKVVEKLKQRVKYINNIVSYCEKENKQYGKKHSNYVCFYISAIIYTFFIFPASIVYIAWNRVYDKHNFYESDYPLATALALYCLFHFVVCSWWNICCNSEYKEYNLFKRNRYKIAGFSTYVDEENNIWHKDFDEWIVGYSYNRILLNEFIRELKKKEN